MWRGPSRGPRGEYLPRAPPKERVMGKPTCATLAVSLPSLLSRASVRRWWRWRLWRAALGRCCALCSVSTRARDHLLQCHFLCYDLPLYARASWPLFGIEPFRCLPVRRVRKEVESAARGPASARGFHASATPFRLQRQRRRRLQLATTNHDGEHPRPTQRSCQIIRLGC